MSIGWQSFHKKVEHKPIPRNNCTLPAA